MSLKGLFDGKIVDSESAIKVRHAPRPGAPHRLEMSWPLDMSSAASLNRFGTVVFGDGIMSSASYSEDPDGGDRRPCFRIDEAKAAIDLGGWWPIVPDAYKPAVAKIVEEMFPRFDGLRMTQDRLELFIVELRDAIWRGVEPVR